MVMIVTSVKRMEHLMVVERAVWNYEFDVEICRHCEKPIDMSEDIVRIRRYSQYPSGNMAEGWREGMGAPIDLHWDCWQRITEVLRYYRRSGGINGEISKLKGSNDA